VIFRRNPKMLGHRKKRKGIDGDAAIAPGECREKKRRRFVLGKKE